MTMTRHAQIALLTLALAAPSPAAPVDFVRDVRPILEKHCHSCHGPARQRSGLRLDHKAGTFKGGDAFGPAVVPGKPDASPLVQLVRGTDPDKVMPPKGERLSPTQIATLANWIREGAVWPDNVDAYRPEDPRDHWAFKPVAAAQPPPVANLAWSREDLDRFILARLEKEGLRPAPEASRATWLRRVSLDLAGLPPTPEEVADFLADARGDAYERVVDRLLASPRHGERWAQHWLDVVRYADTHGFEVNTERPHAWPYRDYVIRALNADTPYDRFVREQLVGDALGEDAATGFLVTASVLLPGQIGADDASKRLARQDALDEMVINTGQTFLGLGVGCARCHDHKFDPILQREYYGLQAFFAGVEYGDRPVRSVAAQAARREAKRVRSLIAAAERRLAALEPPVGSGAVRPAVNARRNTDRFAPVKTQRLRYTILATNNREPCVDELEVFDLSGTNVALAASGTKVTSSGDTTVADRHELHFVNDGRYGNSRSWMSNETGKGWLVLEFPREVTVDRVVWSRDRDGKYADRLAVDYRVEVADGAGAWRTVADASDRIKYARDAKPAPFSTAGLSATEAEEAKQLFAERKTLESRLLAAEGEQLAFAGIFRAPDVTRLLHRGDPEQPKEEVGPTVPAVLGTLSLPKGAAEAERRRALADWITDPRHPLTARVLVNRVWQGHFGAGLVDTPSDFGRAGARPTHPELLDFLANEFIRSGWSLKRLHRRLVLSATYRQSARLDPAGRARDADARLLWRYPSRRLEAEAVRDSMLAVSGRLNGHMGGPGFNLFDKRGGLTGFTPVESFGPEGRRRMIYSHRVRRERDAVFGALDCPDNGQSTARRRESTTPLQALSLFNSRFTLDEAEALAVRARAEVGGDPASGVRRTYQLALGRDPTPAELAEAEPAVREHGLAVLCRALFNSSEFLYLP